ncbi:MAG: BadF/BadG/BcrA/BcrD ATPase family protein [Pseudomonadota bacterium]
MSVLAIDGGGTRCRFALIAGAARYEIEGGPANAFSDFEGAVATLTEGLDALSKVAQVPRADLVHLPAFAGLAGAVSDDTIKRLEAALPLTRAIYADDRLAAMRGALGEADGVVAHCGTGSFFAAQIDGKARLAGGWGATLGDEASAGWVARTVLSYVLQAEDAFREKTALTTSLLHQLAGVSGILAFARTATPEAFGALAPQVTSFAEKGDPIATEILTRGADYLSHGADCIGWVPGLPLCLTGGIGPKYAPYLPHNKQKDLVPPQGTPLDGAIQLARAHGERLAHGYS